MGPGPMGLDLLEISNSNISLMNGCQVLKSLLGANDSMI